MRIIIIEDHNKDFPTIAMNEQGEPIIFDNMIDAEKEADDLQEPIIVTLEE